MFHSDSHFHSYYDSYHILGQITSKKEIQFGKMRYLEDKALNSAHNFITQNRKIPLNFSRKTYLANVVISKIQGKVVRRVWKAPKKFGSVLFRRKSFGTANFGEIDFFRMKNCSYNFFREKDFWQNKSLTNSETYRLGL